MIFFRFKDCFSYVCLVPLRQSGRPRIWLPWMGVPNSSTHQQYPVPLQHCMGRQRPCSSHWGLQVPILWVVGDASIWHLVLIREAVQTGFTDQCTVGSFETMTQQKSDPEFMVTLKVTPSILMGKPNAFQTKVFRSDCLATMEESKSDY